MAQPTPIAAAATPAAAVVPLAADPLEGLPANFRRTVAPVAIVADVIDEMFKLMEIIGHKSLDTLRGYVRDQKLFENHAAAGLL